MQKLIERYWDASASNRLEAFDFEPLFDRFETKLKDKLAKHGCLSLQEYIDAVKEYYDADIFNKLAYSSNHIQLTFTAQDIERCIFEPRYKAFNKRYSKQRKFVNLINLYNDLTNRYLLISTKDKMLLAEKCISAEHNSGRIAGLNIEKLRKDYECRIDKLKWDSVFNIYTRAGLEEEIARSNNKFFGLFIDFADIGEMNEKYGYDKVNAWIRNTLECFNQPNCIVGRYFSGDEIIVLKPKEKGQIWLDANWYKMLSTFEWRAKGNGLAYRWIPLSNIATLEDVADILARGKMQPATSILHNLM